MGSASAYRWGNVEFNPNGAAVNVGSYTQIQLDVGDTSAIRRSSITLYKYEDEMDASARQLAIEDQLNALQFIWQAKTVFPSEGNQTKAEAYRFDRVIEDYIPYNCLVKTFVGQNVTIMAIGYGPRASANCVASLMNSIKIN